MKHQKLPFRVVVSKSCASMTHSKIDFTFQYTDFHHCMLNCKSLKVVNWKIETSGTPQGWMLSPSFSLLKNHFYKYSKLWQNGCILHLRGASDLDSSIQKLWSTTFGLDNPKWEFLMFQNSIPILKIFLLWMKQQYPDSNICCSLGPEDSKNGLEIDFAPCESLFITPNMV